MRMRTGIVGIAGMAVAAAATTLAGGPAGAPPAAASSLSAFADCDAMVGWLKARAERQVGPYGWADGGPWTATMGDVAVAGSAALERSAAPQATTGTNVQEDAVDESDVAKTDGRRVVRITGDSVESWDVTGQPRRVAAHRLPGGLMQPELMLAGENVIVIGTLAPVGSNLEGVRFMPTADHTAVITLDPGLRQIHDRTIDGTLVSARQYGSVVRVVTTRSHPTLAFSYPKGPRGTREATARNREVVRRSSAADWLPRMRVDGRDVAPDCRQIRRPSGFAGTDLISVTAFDGAADSSATTQMGVVASGSNVYSTADHLYVASRRYPDTWLRRGPLRGLPSGGTTTSVHEFALDGLEASYVASGTVSGSLRDRWSMDEYDGQLRLVVTRGEFSDRAETSLVTLTRSGDRLVPLGRIDGIGRGEAVQSVRFFDDLAVVVTFRQVDPLHTIDLSDPAHPRLRGELKVPGFSSYLHPIGGDRLLGLGSSAGPTGGVTGAQASVFSIADLAAPRQVSSVALPGESFDSSWDPHAFTWVPERDTALVVARGQTPGGDLVALTVSPAGRVTTRTLASGLTAGNERTLPLGGGRVALVGEQVRLLFLSPQER